MYIIFNKKSAKKTRLAHDLYFNSCEIYSVCIFVCTLLGVASEASGKFFNVGGGVGGVQWFFAAKKFFTGKGGGYIVWSEKYILLSAKKKITSHCFWLCGVDSIVVMQ